MKFRIIPTILTDGLTVVKGEKFDNWRTVGSTEAIARLFGSRDVDELMFLDVTARSRDSIIDLNLLKHFSDVLDIPFSVGGGINTLEEAKLCFRYGAEKVVLGTAAVAKPNLITDISNIFGNQAVIVAVDFVSDSTNEIRIKSGKEKCSLDGLEFIGSLERLGAGEVLIQSIERDGTLVGLDLQRIINVAKTTNLPLIASGGAATTENFYEAVQSGASAVAAGALFQFTQLTPTQVRKQLFDLGVKVRNVG
jgi:cyclase